jgi:hypothetical protein
VSSRETYGIDLLGPVRPDVSWQHQDPQAFDITQFRIDWDRHVVICPMGQTSRCWWPANGPRGKPTLQVHFGEKDCLACESRARCTKSALTAAILNLNGLGADDQVFVGGEGCQRSSGAQGWPITGQRRAAGVTRN